MNRISRTTSLTLALAITAVSCSGGNGESTDYCGSVESWSGQSAAAEEQVIELINIERAQGADCGAEGTFDPAPPLAFHDALRCAARNHSKDMWTKDYFDHLSPSGGTPADRFTKSGYAWMAIGENIAFGSAQPAKNVQGWMQSDPHCANIMNPSFKEVGVGFFNQDGRPYWTTGFGTR
jgi:uncharacterized protein YkwD